ncbi:MAG: hypothetical protein WAW79_11955 [Steroidobacteraceae bacterium]
MLAFLARCKDYFYNVPPDKARAVVDAMERDMENRCLGSMMVAGFGLTIAAMRLWA